MNYWMIKKTFYEIIFIIFLSVAVSFTVNHICPNMIQPSDKNNINDTDEITAQEISIETAKKLIDEKAAILIDSRSRDEFIQDYIKGALNLPEQEFGECIDNFLSNTDPETIIITYCDGSQCDLAKNLAEKLKLIGFSHVFYIKNGRSRWNEKYGR